MLCKLLGHQSFSEKDPFKDFKEALKNKEIEDKKRDRSIEESQRLRDEYIERRKDPWKKMPGGRRHYDP